MSERTLEEYLESIGALEQIETPVTTSSLANHLGIAPASVSEMLHKLSEKGLIQYTPYHGATLTRQGRQTFLQLTRRHRLWEVFLHRCLGFGWEDVYEDACNLEHTTSDRVAETLARFLGDPDRCPHGSPIPKSYDELPPVSGHPLARVSPGQSCRVVDIINERDSSFLRYLTSLGVVPGAKVLVKDKASFDGTLTIEVEGSVKAMGEEAASFIMVEPA